MGFVADNMASHLRCSQQCYLLCFIQPSGCALGLGNHQIQLSTRYCAVIYEYLLVEVGKYTRETLKYVLGATVVYVMSLTQENAVELHSLSRGLKESQRHSG